MSRSHNKRPDRKQPTKRTDRPIDRTMRPNDTSGSVRPSKRSTQTRQQAHPRHSVNSNHHQQAPEVPIDSHRLRDQANFSKNEKNMRADRSTGDRRSYAKRVAEENEKWERLARDQRQARREEAESRRVRIGRPQEPKRPNITIWIAFALVALIAIAFAFSTCSTDSNSSHDNETALTTSDRRADEATTLTLSFAGDCTLGTDEAFDRATSFIAKYDAVSDPSYFFANVADIFSNDDATIVNMEGTLTDSTTRADKTFAFKAPADYAQILKAGNVEAASLANNHSRDYGEQSYTDTIEAVEAVGISTFGYDRIAYLDVKGVKVALIGTYELAEGSGIKDEMIRNIESAKEEGAQIIVVYFHWGTERETVPDSVQMELGHAAIDAGATLVIGSHPHVIQGLENYNGHTIAYSLGNFCFGGNKNPSDKDCMIVQQTFTVQGDRVTVDNTNVIPCSISSISSSNNYQPTPATGSEKERIELKIKKSSDAIATLAGGGGY